MRVSSRAGARAMGIADQMQLKASLENNINHAQHVRDQIDYTNAVAEAYNEQWKEWIRGELPGMIDREIEKYIGQQKVKVELDEQSVKQVRSKIDNLMKTLFK